MCAVVYVMIRLGRLISAATSMVSDYRDRADLLLLGAQEAVDRASEQLDRTDAIAASMDDVTANMAELSGHVSAMAGLARSISGGFGAPLLRISALAYGLRRATGLRLGTQAPGQPPGTLGPSRRDRGSLVLAGQRPGRPRVPAQPSVRAPPRRCRPARAGTV